MKLQVTHSIDRERILECDRCRLGKYSLGGSLLIVKMKGMRRDVAYMYLCTEYGHMNMS
jgi:hypothetical protein